MTTALITGANRGIGLELARQLHARGVTVIAAGRRTSSDLDALGVRFEAVDVADAASVASLAQRLQGVRLDLLINNAGLLRRTSLQNLDEPSVVAMFQVNSLGPLRVTAALQDHLADGGKVVIVTSRMGSMADNGSGGAYGYRMSKAAVNAAGVSLARDLEPRSIAVALLHPGWVRTEMTGGTGNWGPEEAAAGLIARIDELSMETTGRFVHANGDPLPW
jgi:NAD(P)-dependent dehydrogenase (short-subunit alcohol dehydrogenase family)